MFSPVKLSLLTLIIISVTSCSRYKSELSLAEQLMEHNPDSALLILKKIHPKAIISNSENAKYALLLSQAYNKNDSIVSSDSLISIATSYYGNNDPVRAGYAWLYRARCAQACNNVALQAEYLLKAQEFAGNTDAFKLQGLIYSDKADLYQYQVADSAIVNYYKAMKAFEKAGDYYNSTLSAYSVGDMYQNEEKYRKAYSYYQTALNLNKYAKDPILANMIYKGIGKIMYRYKKNNFRKALSFFFQAPVTNNWYYDENRYIFISYCYARMNMNDSALYYINLVKHPSKLKKDYTNILELIHSNNKDYKEALHYANIQQDIRDSIAESRLQESYAGIEKRFHYENLTIQNKNLIIQNKQRGTLLLVILLIVSTVVIIVLSWSFTIKKGQIKILKQLRDREKDLLQKANENNDLLKRQNKFQLMLLQNVEQYRSESSKGRMMGSIVNEEKIIEEVIAYVDGAHNNITSRLARAYPQLTYQDLNMCCMLLAGFDNGMIATILKIKIESVNVHRSRLRKRLQLNSNVNLIQHLQNL